MVSRWSLGLTCLSHRARVLPKFEFRFLKPPSHPVSRISRRACIAFYLFVCIFVAHSLLAPFALVCVISLPTPPPCTFGEGSLPPSSRFFPILPSVVLRKSAYSNHLGVFFTTSPRRARVWDSKPFSLALPIVRSGFFLHISRSLRSSANSSSSLFCTFQSPKGIFNLTRAPSTQILASSVCCAFCCGVTFSS